MALSPIGGKRAFVRFKEWEGIDMAIEVRRFCRKFHKMTGMYANAEVEEVRDEGDCGFVRNHCFDEEMTIGELADIRITREDFEDKGTIEVPRTYTAEGSVSIAATITGRIDQKAAASGKYDDLMEFDFSARKYFEADVSMTFDRSYSYVFSYENATIYELKDYKLRKLRQAIMEAWREKVWPRNYAVVTGFYEADSTTLLISRTRNATVNGNAIIGAEASASARLKEGSPLTEAELSKNMSLTFTTSISTHQNEVVDLSDKGATCPILTLRKLKRRGRGRRLQLVEM